MSDRTSNEQRIADAWNVANVVGTPVRYWTGLRKGGGVESRTRTEASVLGGHTAVVWVEGEGACIALTHVEPLPSTGEHATCAHGADDRTCFRCAADGPSVPLPADWRREGMVVVADSMSGRLLGCMGRDTWLAMHPNTPGLNR